MDDILHVLTLAREQVVGRLTGPLNFRLVVMPTVVSVLALRSVWKDLRDERPCFLGWLLKDPGERDRLIQQGLNVVGRIFIVAIVLDIVYQAMVFGRVYPGMVLLVAFVCAIVPYFIVRVPVYLLAHYVLRKVRERRAARVQPKQAGR